MLFLLSLFSWIGLLWYSILHPNFGIAFRNRGGGGSTTTVTSHTYYYYRIKFPHCSIDPSQPILFYNTYGTLIYTLPAYYEFMDYGNGILAVPGSEKNTTVESVSTASYYVFYSNDSLIIDYDKALFKISKALIKSELQSKVTANFEYFTVITAFKDIASVIDGRWDTQVQTEFFSEPPTGYNYAIIDLGSSKSIQALDIVAGFFKPDDIRKYDIDFTFTLQYSTDNINYYEISDETHSVELGGGESKSFEEKELGIDFQARYLKLILEKVKKIDYSSDTITVSDSNRVNLIARGLIGSQTENGTLLTIREGEWVVALSEISAYDNIIIESETKLIPTTQLTEDLNITYLESGSYPTTINVISTDGFLIPSTVENAYILNSDGTYDNFTYTGLTATSFTGIVGLSQNHTIDKYVVQELEGDLTVYDFESLLPKLKDRIYKANKIDDNTLFSVAQLNYVSREHLKEFIKNHTKIQVNVSFAPHIEVGQTIKVVEAYNHTNTRYFVDSIKDSGGSYQITLARFPGFNS